MSWDKVKQFFSTIYKKIKSIDKRHWNVYGFYFLVGFVIVNVIIFSLYLINGNTNYRIFNHAYAEAVTPNQDINGVLRTDIVKITKPKEDSLVVGEKIVFYGDFNLDVNWVEELVSINESNQTVNATYDQIIATTISYDDISGIYVKDANFIGVLFYFSSFIRGYITIIMIDGIIIFSYYLYLIKKQKTGLFD